MPALKKIILKLAYGSFPYVPEMNNLLFGKQAKDSEKEHSPKNE